ncbi:MAG: amino acid ABC transporter permease [Gammaproteobacteria bacterium]|nr:amino acid ABC transporter permease [Gammaproteobacteria bacterium]
MASSTAATASGSRPRAWSWLRRHLFATPLDGALTLAALALIGAIGAPALRWLVLDAYWLGATPDACPDRSAACWPFIWARFDQFMYGLYPATERWRVNLGIGLGLVLAVPLFLHGSRDRFVAALLFFAGCVLIGWLLLLGGHFGLPVVATGQWGGFFLTIVTAVFVFSTSLPLGILLALGRQSSLPLLRFLCTGWIELWRSVPALVVLFVAIIMFPLFMPAGLEIDKLLRALIALTILMSSYLAEAVRGALLSLPRGQYEAGAALGLGYWQRTMLVVLPQALPVALPQITSNFISLFKETTVLLVIGLFDLLGMVQTAASDPAWMGRGVSATGYCFAALFFWAFCFGLSRYGHRVEKRMSAHRADTRF